jgi:O-methyltransferase
LPAAQEIDGETARTWQSEINSPAYYDNCKADLQDAIEAMKLSGAENYFIKKGWFEDTLLGFTPKNAIAILRLDADWYQSTKICLEKLYPFLAPQALIIIDDYYTWDGCSKAVHDFLSEQKLSDRIYCTKEGIAYIIKKK